MKITRNIFLAFVMAISMGHKAPAQIRHSFFSNYTIRDGLTDNIIHCIYQDSKGWIWMGTTFGAGRFDGYTFKKFDIGTQESDVMGKSLIRTITEDREGNIWIGSENQGIFIYKRDSCKLKQIKKQGKYDQLCCNSIWSIVEDAQGKIWIATEQGLNRFDPVNQSLTAYTQNSRGSLKLIHDFVRILRFDHKGNLWIGTSEGITVFDFAKNTSRNYLTDIPEIKRENEVWEIYEDSRNQIWVGTYLGGMKRLNPATDSFEQIELEKNNERAKTVRAVVQDKKGYYWIATRGGLYRIDAKDNKIAHFEHNDLDDNSLVHNSVIELIIDKKGDLWAGTRDGISHLNFDKQAFGNISAGKNPGLLLNHSEVYVFWEGTDDDIWIGTEAGGINIYNYHTNRIAYLTRENGLSNNCIKALCSDQNGHLLIGTYLGGLNILDLNTGSVEYLKHNPADTTTISDNDVWSIIRDGQGRFWVGTANGLDLFDMKTRTFRRLGKKFNMSNVLMVYEDSRGRIWAYSENLKLTMIDTDGKTRDFPFKARTMCDDKDNNLWIGTLGNGLVKFNPETNETKTYTVEDGLCNNIIYGIINVDDHYLWLSTINGISRFDLQTKKFKNFFHNDGLLNSQFNYGAYLRESDGTLVFGGGKGVDFIFLDQLDENRFVPPIVFTDFKVFNEPVPVVLNKEEVKNALPNLISETKQIVLDYDQNMLTFEFAALNYANSEKNEYQYKLEGFDRGWNKIGNQRRATYTNLDPGEYTLRVLGSNNDGLYNTEGASLNITILPPFWKTLWFRLVIVIVLISIGYTIYVFIANREKLKSQLLIERQSARKVQELERLKHQFFMNISHEIRTPLSLILGPLDKLLNNDLDAEIRKSHLEIIHRNTRNLTQLVNQLLDYRRLETGNVRLELSQGNLVSFLKDVYSTFSELAEEKKIELTFHATQPEIVAFFDSDKIEKIVNNLMSNALKYTNEGGKVGLSVTQVFQEDIDDTETYLPPFDRNSAHYEKYIQITVKDTGIGIPGSQLGKIFNRFKQVTNSSNRKTGGYGIGLYFAKELVNIHKGYILVKSKEGKGSRFSLLIPLIEELEENKVPAAPDSVVHSTHSEQATQVFDEESVKSKRISQQPIILIVDDNPDIKKFLTHHFEPEYQVVTARNGIEGWELALEVVPDIILADIMMPLMDGREFCRKIKKDERTSHIPVVILTALSSRENQMAGIDAGVDDYIVKPFDVTLLCARVDNIISIRKGLRERFSKEMLLRPSEVILASPDEKFLKKVVHVIEKNMDNIEFDVDQMAANIGVSRTQLYRKIAALTNMTAKEFVRDLRLQRAAQMIVQNKLNISEVALQTGFNDISYFRKCFKEKYGMSASEYSRKHSETELESV